jgi:hypothetical protein
VLAAWSPRGGAASLRAPADKVSRKRRREHREGGSDAPDEVAAVRAHLSRGSTCGGRVEVARRCPTVAEVLRSRRRQWRGPTAPEERGEGEAHATCEPQRTEDRLTEEAETRRRGWLGPPVVRR